MFKKKLGVWGTIIVLIIAGVFIFGLFTISRSENTFAIEDNTLNVKGMYGRSYDLEGASVELLEDKPNLIRKVNGTDVRNGKKGLFNVEELGRCRVYIHQTTGPCIMLTTESDIVLIILKEDGDTIKLYNELEAAIGS